MSSSPDHHGSNQPSNKVAILLFIAVAIFLSLWATSIVLFGVPGLYIPALIMVPIIGATLVLITRG